MNPDSDNHLGSSSFLTDAAGDPYQFVLYLPFGETFAEDRAAGYATPYRFNAKELDEETGLYYYGARYYDPRVSMWWGVDPLAGDAPDWTPYRYAFNNPVRYIDPNGLYEDTYGVDNEGNINKIDDKKHYDKDGNEVDLLVKGNQVVHSNNGNIKNAHTYVKPGILRQGLKKKTLTTQKDGIKHYTHMSAGSFESEGTNLFEFLGNNTDVEWSIIQTEPIEGLTSTSIFTSHEHDREFVAPSLLLDKGNPGLIGTLKYHHHSHPPTNRMLDSSRLTPSDEDRSFAKKIREAGSSAVLKIYFNGQYSPGY